MKKSAQVNSSKDLRHAINNPYETNKKLAADGRKKLKSKTFKTLEKFLEQKENAPPEKKKANKKTQLELYFEMAAKLEPRRPGDVDLPRQRFTSFDINKLGARRQALIAETAAELTHSYKASRDIFQKINHVADDEMSDEPVSPLLKQFESIKKDSFAKKAKEEKAKKDEQDANKKKRSMSMGNLANKTVKGKEIAKNNSTQEDSFNRIFLPKKLMKMTKKVREGQAENRYLHSGSEIESLFNSVVTANVVAVRRILDSRIDASETFNETTVLHIAVAGDRTVESHGGGLLNSAHIQVIKALLDNNANPNKLDFQKKSVLDVAMQMGTIIPELSVLTAYIGNNEKVALQDLSNNDASHHQRDSTVKQVSDSDNVQEMPEPVGLSSPEHQIDSGRRRLAAILAPPERVEQLSEVIGSHQAYSRHQSPTKLTNAGLMKPGAPASPGAHPGTVEKKVQPWSPVKHPNPGVPSPANSPRGVPVPLREKGILKDMSEVNLWTDEMLKDMRSAKFALESLNLSPLMIDPVLKCSALHRVTSLAVLDVLLSWLKKRVTDSESWVSDFLSNVDEAGNTFMHVLLMRFTTDPDAAFAGMEKSQVKDLYARCEKIHVDMQKTSRHSEFKVDQHTPSGLSPIRFKINDEEVSVKARELEDNLKADDLKHSVHALPGSGSSDDNLEKKKVDTAPNYNSPYKANIISSLIFQVQVQVRQRGQILCYIQILKFHRYKI